MTIRGTRLRVVELSQRRHTGSTTISRTLFIPSHSILTRHHHGLCRPIVRSDTSRAGAAYKRRVWRGERSDPRGATSYDRPITRHGTHSYVHNAGQSPRTKYTSLRARDDDDDDDDGCHTFFSRRYVFSPLSHRIPSCYPYPAHAPRPSRIVLRADGQRRAGTPPFRAQPIAAAQRRAAVDFETPRRRASRAGEEESGQVAECAWFSGSSVFSHRGPCHWHVRID